MCARPLLSVAICGGGACGLAVLLCLLREHEASPCIASIHLYEKRPRVGPGVAYSESANTAIINMAAETMGLDEGDPLHFVRWLKEEYRGVGGGAGAEDRAGAACRYPPRHVYGDYLAARFADAQRWAAKQGVRLTAVHCELADLSVVEAGRFQLANTGGSHVVVVDKVVLAVGNFAACTQPHLVGRAGYIDSAWSLPRLDAIPPAAAVCIVGSRLSGIDAALYLAARGHLGPIYLASRGGRLPSVQLQQKRPHAYTEAYVLQILCRAVEEKQEKHRQDRQNRQPPPTIQDLAGPLQTLLEQLGMSDCAAALVHKPDQPLARLSQDMREAAAAAAAAACPSWRALPDAAAPCLERFWHCLPLSDRAAFLQQWNSTWLTLVHAMPYENACRLQALLSTGRVRVVDDLAIIEALPTPTSTSTPSFLLVRRAGKTASTADTTDKIGVDVVVEATGLELDVARVPSPLLRSLLSATTSATTLRGGSLVDAHPLGGLSVDPHTLETKTPGLYALGSMTTGVHFYTNGIDRNVVHAARIARHLVTGRPVRVLPVHVALVVGPAAYECVAEAVRALVQENTLPFVYFVGEEDGTAASCTKLALQLRQAFGIYAAPTEVSELGRLLSEHYIDIGVLSRCCDAACSRATEAVPAALTAMQSVLCKPAAVQAEASFYLLARGEGHSEQRPLAHCIERIASILLDFDLGRPETVDTVS